MNSKNQFQGKEILFVNKMQNNIQVGISRSCELALSDKENIEEVHIFKISEYSFYL